MWPVRRPTTQSGTAFSYPAHIVPVSDSRDGPRPDFYLVTSSGEHILIEAKIDAKALVGRTGGQTVKVVDTDAVRSAYQAAPSSVPHASRDRLLSASLQRLPPSQRTRYAEEWAADLLEIHGRLARLRWQLGIRLTARRLARIAQVHSPAHRG
jgi:hypothetical protein